MKKEKITFFWVISIELKKSTLYFWSYYSIEPIRYNSFKVYKFLKTGVHEKCMLINSKEKFIRLSYLKLILIQLINRLHCGFGLWKCLSDVINLLLSTNVLLFDVFFILLHHFVLFFYPQLEKEISRQKEK